MAKKRLPLRMNLLRHLAVADGPRTGQEIFAEFTREYGQERQCTLTALMDHLLNMVALGLVALDNERFDHESNLVVDFTITEEGQKCRKYYPAAWQF